MKNMNNFEMVREWCASRHKRDGERCIKIEFNYRILSAADDAGGVGVVVVVARPSLLPPSRYSRGRAQRI